MKKIIPFIPVLGAICSEYPIREKYFGIFFVYQVLSIGIITMLATNYIGHNICKLLGV